MMTQELEASKNGEAMTSSDLVNAIYFLRKVSVGQMDVDRLISTVEALEKELEKRSKRK
jgi:benzoyl-CoA reductase/2-hydroxyglutaryl-CoA dehydratase subunit BcrC/BadD/HgdB